MKNRYAVNPHPFTIIENMGNLLFLLIFPVVRGLASAFLGGSLISWLSGAWFDILIVMIIVGYAVVKWKTYTFCATSVGINIKHGILFRREYYVRFENISTLSITEPVLYRPFRVVQLFADTLAGSPERTDIKITLSKDVAQKILDLRRVHLKDTPYVKKNYEPLFRYIGLLSIILSNGITGAAFAAASISQLGSVLGEEFETQVFGTLAIVSKILAFGIPPLTAFIAIVIGAGWLIALLRNMLRYFKFNVTRKKDIIEISGGLLTRRFHCLSIPHINHLDIRQSLFTKLFRLYMVFVDCTGYGKSKNSFPALLPASSQKQLKSRIKALLPEYKIMPRFLKPVFLSEFKFLMFPFFCSLGVLAAGYILNLIIPSWSDVIISLTIIGFVPVVWWFFVNLADLLSAGAAADSQCITLFYSKGYYLHTAVIPKDKVTMICMRQSIFQRMGGACDVIVSSYSEKVKKHHVKNLDLKNVCELFGLK